MTIVSGGPGRRCIIGKEVVKDINEIKYRPTGDLVQKFSDGRLLYLGRTDNQIKRQGKRINLSQIEQVDIFTDFV